MLDQNRTPRRDLTENAESLFEAVDAGKPLLFQNFIYKLQYFLENCDLSGAWYNQHGSELSLNQSENGILTGEFRSAVKLPRKQNQGKLILSSLIILLHSELFRELRQDFRASPG